MSKLDRFIASMAASLIDDELAWRVQRLPEVDKQSIINRALLREAQRRGLSVTQHLNWKQAG
jgi:hypothetical protein